MTNMKVSTLAKHHTLLPLGKIKEVAKSLTISVEK
jgi:hypothetical protein